MSLFIPKNTDLIEFQIEKLSDFIKLIAVQGSLRTNKGIRNQIHKIIKSLRSLQNLFLFEFFTERWIINQTNVIIHQMIINRVAFSSVNITEEVKTLNFLTNHIAIIHSPKLVNDENHSHTSNSPNNTKSTNAVIFANAANPKNNQAIMIYFNISFLSLEPFLF